MLGRAVGWILLFVALFLIWAAFQSAHGAKPMQMKYAAYAVKDGCERWLMVYRVHEAGGRCARRQGKLTEV